MEKVELKSRKFIDSACFTIHFDPIDRIEKKIYEMEDHLKSLFPDEAIDTKVPINYDPGTPRFILRDDKKRRFLEIALDKATFKIELTKEYSSDVDKGIQYYKDKSLIILNALEKIIQPDCIILSNKVALKYSFNDKNEDYLKSFLPNKFLNKLIEKPFSFHFNLAYKKNNDYSINYTAKDYKKIQFVLDSRKMKPNVYLRLKETDESVQVTDKGIDITIETIKTDENEVLHRDNIATIFEKLFEHTRSANNNLEDFLL